MEELHVCYTLLCKCASGLLIHVAAVTTFRKQLGEDDELPQEEEEGEEELSDDVSERCPPGALNLCRDKVPLTFFLSSTLMPHVTCVRC